MKAKEGKIMLILRRKTGESVTIGDNIRLTVLDIQGKQIKLGIDAPKSIVIHREEIYKKIVDQNKEAILEKSKADLLQLAKMLQSAQSQV